MVLYKCNRCNKEFNRKSNYNYHINRKKPCKKVNQKQKSKLIKTNHTYKCFNCNKIYSTKSNLNRHIKQYCKELQEITENNHKNDQTNQSYKYNILDDQEVYYNTSNDINRRLVLSKKEIVFSNKEIVISKKERLKCVYCNKSISVKRNLKRHYKVCKMKPKCEFEQVILKEKREFKEKLEEKDKILQEHIEQLQKKNQEHVEQLLKKDQELLELKETEEEYFKFMKHMAKKNNITYNDNKSINMFFIMKNYKDAKNYETLMDPALTTNEIKQIKESSVQAGVYNLINNRCIEGLEIEERPFHCVDHSRNKYLLRISDDWSRGFASNLERFAF